MPGARSIALAILLAVTVGCGPSERPKFNIKRASDYEPLPAPEPPPATATESSATDSASPSGTEMTVIEIGAFKGTCDQSFSGVNDQDLISLANRTGLRNYRLAGIAIPPEIRAQAHQQLRAWLDGAAIGVEIESGSGNLDPPAFIYRCATKSMVNAELVRAGLAVVVDTPSPHRDLLNQASMEALTARRGVWAKK